MQAKTTPRVCVPVCASSLSRVPLALDHAARLADLVELRLDCLNVNELPDFNCQNLSRLDKAVILTLRAAEQGGHNRLTTTQRLEFWTKWLTSDSTLLFDIEFDLLPLIDERSNVDWSRVIVSHHDFNGVPEDIFQIYKRMVTSPAAIGKIALTTNDVVDCLPIFDLLDRARADQKQLIAIGMGSAGVITRILGPSRGAYLTYAASSQDAGTAPGQITAEQLRSVYRLDHINADTFVCGIIGLPVMHSVSPHIHNAAFARLGLNGVYLPMEVSDVDAFFKRMVRRETREMVWNLRGLSVTAPHKSTVIQYLDEVDEKATKIGAVNTILVEDGKLTGYNTDADGFLEPLLHKIHSLVDVRVAVLGAGGAARAVLWALSDQRASVTLFARDLAKGRRLSEEFGAPARDIVDASFGNFDVVINTTPLGSYGNLVEQSPATIEQLAGAKLVYDLVYNPRDTKFLANGRAAGCDVLSGLEMLVAQAKRQFEIWTGLAPDTETMMVAAQHGLDMI
jgi:3-dehydroquinate dehydratase/shikimate dehydrogenase